MLYLGPLGFVNPWLLGALAALPAIWWLLRAIPPPPRREWFPAIRLLMGLQETPQSPNRTPWWLLALRLVLAALVILALARPLLNPTVTQGPGGPLIAVIDDGWTAAAQWPARQAALEAWIDQAERNNRQVLLLTTARTDAAQPPPPLLSAAAAKAAIASLQPKPWRLDRADAALRLAAMDLSDAAAGGMEAVWFSDGVAADADQAGAQALSAALMALGPLTILRDPPQNPVMALGEPRTVEDGFDLDVLRSHAGNPYTAELHALGEDGNILAIAQAQFSAGQTVAAARLDLPAAVRNGVTRIHLAGVPSTAAVWLLDDRWKRRLAGLVSGTGFESAQPLLDDLFYLDRAMTPFADIRKGTIAKLLETPLSMLVLADIGRIVGEEKALVEDWLEKGGILVRFAGPNMVEQSDELIPVRIRQGGRALGGALSWDVPAQLAPFAPGSPFSGLKISPDVTVSRQILAEPEAGLADKSWASLHDGTPLVTAARKGKGWIILFHVTANTRWSNLPVSGLYVSMLQRIVSLSGGTGQTGVQQHPPLNPLVMLDGYGRLRAPLETMRPFISTDTPPDIGPHLPPGYYGGRDFRLAVNLPRDAGDLRPMQEFSGAVNLEYGPREETELRPWLLGAAFILLLADGWIALALLGRLPWRLAGRSAAFLVMAAAAVFSAPESRAQDRMLDAALNTRLAYVITGDAEVDGLSAAGLAGLSGILRERTAFEPADPVGVNLDTDELVFFPLLYWPMTPSQPPLSDKALARIDGYMKNGGTILFDTRDQLTNFNLGEAVGPGQQMLRQILDGLDIPPLAPVTEEHVLSKSFYLLRDFPGRYAGGKLWVRASSEGVRDQADGDGVSAIVIGANDWAAAWAADANGGAVVPIEPGGATQRELAYRTGVNLVMYTLTGNYKADQVHVPALLERLGQ